MKQTYMRLLAAALTFAMLLAFLPTMALAAEEPVLTGNSVYRESTTVATVRFLSDAAGTAYYQITNSETPPDDVVTGGTDGGAVDVGVTKVMSLTGLTAGAKYAHIVVKDEGDQVSNTLTIAMPYDVYYYEDFEAYPAGTLANSDAMSLAYVTAFDPSAQKVVDDTSNRALTLVGGNEHYPCVKLDLPDNLTGTLVLEADIKPVAGSNPAYLRLHNSTDMVTVRPISDSGNRWNVQKQRISSESPSYDYALDDTFSFATWYKVKMVYSFDTNSFDVYIDDEKVNNTPYTGFSSSIKHTFQLLAGNAADAASLYDNVAIYNTAAVPVISGLSASSATLGSSGGNTTITVSGSDLSDGITVTVFDGATATTITGTPTGGAAAQTVALTFPANGGDADKVYTVKASLDGGTSWDDETCTVTVQKKAVVAPSSGGGSAPAPTPAITTVNQPENGSMAISPAKPVKGDAVTVNITPDEGFAISGITVKDKKGKRISVSSNADGSYRFTHPGDEVIIEAELVPLAAFEPEGWQNPFIDVSENAWYFDAVQYVAENGLMNGTDAITFAPDISLSRAMLVQILYNLEGRPGGGSKAFSDVDAGAWYADAVAWAAANAIVSGMGDDLFDPDGDITREQMAVMLYHYCKYKSMTLPDMTDAGIADVAAVSDWALAAVEAMYQAGILGGKGGGVFDPGGIATRAEVAQMIMNFMEAIQ